MMNSEQGKHKHSEEAAKVYPSNDNFFPLLETTKYGFKEMKVLISPSIDLSSICGIMNSNNAFVL